MKKLILTTLLTAAAVTWNIRCDHDDDDDRDAEFETLEAKKIFENRVWVAPSVDGESIYGFVFFKDSSDGVWLKQTQWSMWQEVFFWNYAGQASSKTLDYEVSFPHRQRHEDIEFGVYECPQKDQFDLCVDISDDTFGSHRFYSMWDMVVENKEQAHIKLDVVKRLHL